jgi:hypothetical protein
MEDPTVNTIFSEKLHMINEFVNNNFRSEGLRKQRSKYKLSRVSIELIKIFAQSSRVFAQTLNLLVELVENLI